MIKALIIDGYQTCIWTGENALEKAMEAAYAILANKYALCPFRQFSSIYLQSAREVANKLGTENPILLDDVLLFKETFAKLGLPISEESLVWFANQRWDAFSKIIYLYPEVQEVLLQLKRQFRLILCVDGCGKYEQKIMERLGLTNLFEMIIITDRYGASKSNENTWLRIISDLSLTPDEVLVIDDRPEVLVAASKCNLKIVRTRRGKYMEKENLVQPSFEIYDFQELLNGINKLEELK